MGQYNMSTKELVRSYSFNDIYTNRNDERRKVIKGRTTIELGTRIATSFVGNLYRVYDSSVESFKYLLMVGVARQNPEFDSPISVEEAEEAAATNAWLNPILTYKVEQVIDDDHFLDLCLVMREMMPTIFVKTPEEKNILFIEA
jgi:hypothetical protein